MEEKREICYTAPVRLTSERAWRTYHGGRLIDEMQGPSPAADAHFPEDWIMSTVRAINAGREEIVEGLNRLADADLTLKDFIAADSAAALGAAHVAKWGESPAVLVKLIDAAERLGIQCHPDRDRARQFFGSPFGKTECWHIVGGRAIDGEKPCVYMGFKPGVTEAAWRDVFDRQDIPAMLGMLHRIEVKPGDTFLIEGGMPHAIGAGCLLVEIQEPTDYTFRTEKVTPQGFAISEKACHYGIGFDNMFACFHYEGFDEAETRRRRMVAPQVLEEAPGYTRTQIVGRPQTNCFTLERYDIRSECRFAAEGEFFGLYFLSGRGWMESAVGKVEVTPGTQFCVSAATAAFTVSAAEPIVAFRAKSAA